MMTREALVQAAREGRLFDGTDGWGNGCFFLDEAPLLGPGTKHEIEQLFAEHIFTFDHAEIDSMAHRIPVRIREGN
jgi:hypothetical protein